MTDRQTHRPTDRRKGKNNVSPDPFRGGGIMTFMPWQSPNSRKSFDECYKQSCNVNAIRLDITISISIIELSIELGIRIRE